jgi:hypothetical protein
MPPRPLLFSLIAAAAPALLLGGCKRHTDDAAANSSTAAISITNASDGSGQSVSVTVPGYATKVELPQLQLGSATQIENMKLLPGTRVATVDVRAQAGDGSGGETRGNVSMRFSAPASADAVVDYYRGEAQRNGWTIVPPGGNEQFAATRANTHGGTTRFGLQVMPGSGTDSTGRFTVTGG